MLRLSTVLLLLATPALADEVWTTDGGTVVYWEDRDGIAILKFPYGDGEGHLYVYDLVGALDARSVHDAYWIAPTPEGPCDQPLTGVDGLTSQSWGVATVTFDATAFPSGFTADMGECATDNSWELRGDTP